MHARGDVWFVESRANRWLSVLTIDDTEFGANAASVRLALESQNIDARPVWKPMHQQPVFTHAESIGGHVADDLFAQGLCLPSGSAMTAQEQDRVIDAVRHACLVRSAPRHARSAA